MSRVHAPLSLGEALELLARHPEAVCLAGGTDLLVKARRHGGLPEDVVLLERVAALQDIAWEGDALRVGACVAHARLLAWLRREGVLPVLARALAGLGSPAVRNMGTLGGNCCTASPAGDCLPPLAVLGARLELASLAGTRELDLPAFHRGPGRTALAPGEILVAVRLPAVRRFDVQHFEKVGLRDALAIATVSLAVAARRESDGAVAEIRLAWGGVAPTVLRCPEAEAVLVGTRLEPAALKAAAALARAAARPLDDLRGTAAWRREVTGNLLLRLAGVSG